MLVGPGNTLATGGNGGRQSEPPGHCDGDADTPGLELTEGSCRRSSSQDQRVSSEPSTVQVSGRGWCVETAGPGRPAREGRGHPRERRRRGHSKGGWAVVVILGEQQRQEQERGECFAASNCSPREGLRKVVPPGEERVVTRTVPRKEGPGKTRSNSSVLKTKSGYHHYQSSGLLCLSFSVWVSGPADPRTLTMAHLSSCLLPQSLPMARHPDVHHPTPS